MYPSKSRLGRETKEEKKSEKDELLFSILRQTSGERENRGELRLGWKEVEWDENDVGQEEDCSTKQEQYDEKTYVWISLLEGRLSVTTEDERVEQLCLRLRREWRYEGWSEWRVL